MNCCNNCFLDPSLQKLIESLSIKKGTCDFCGSASVSLVICEDLSVHFETLFELYIPHPTAVGSLKKDEPFLLFQHLKEYWTKLFNADLLDDKLIKILIESIGKGGDIYSD